MSRPPAGKEQVSVYVPVDVDERVRGAIHHLQLEDPELSVSEFYSRAAERYVTELEHGFNSGRAWPAPARTRRGRAPARRLD